MDEDELRKWARHHLDFAKKSLTQLEDGGNSFAPVFSLLKDGKEEIGVMEFDNDEEKSEMQKFLRGKVKDSNPDAMLIVTDAWVVQLNKDVDIDKEPRPSLHPDRTEALTLSAHSGDLVLIAHWSYTRGPSNEIYWADIPKISVFTKETDKLYENQWFS
jgi:hypothetical protein